MERFLLFMQNFFEVRALGVIPLPLPNSNWYPSPAGKSIMKISMPRFGIS